MVIGQYFAVRADDHAAAGDDIAFIFATGKISTDYPDIHHCGEDLGTGITDGRLKILIVESEGIAGPATAAQNNHERRQGKKKYSGGHYYSL